MKKYAFSDGSYFHFTDFLITVSIIEIQIMAISRVEDDAFRVLVLRTPVMQRQQQLLRIVLALKIRMDTEQRQHVNRFRRRTGQHVVVILQIPLSPAQAGAHQHPNAPGPAFGDAQPPLWWRNQGNAGQTVRDEQPQCRHVLKKMLLDQRTDGRLDPVLIAGAAGFEQVGEARFLTVGEVEQCAGFAGVAAVELTDLRRFAGQYRHGVRPFDEPRGGRSGALWVVVFKASSRRPPAQFPRLGRLSEMHPRRL